MNKREIVSLIDLNKKILENKKYDSIVLPEFDEIKDELDILNMEINEGKRVIANAQNEIRKYSCDHSVRFHYPSGWGLMMDDKCVFCGKGIENDCIVNSNTIYEDVNRNRYCVRFISNYFYDCDFYCDSGYDEVDVYEILLKVLEDKNDNDEIDFVKEIKKLNIDKCKIDERRKEKIHYILIVGGSNKYNISEGHYITSDKIPISTAIGNMLRGVPGVRIEVIENENASEAIDFLKSQNMRFVSYETTEELMKGINSEKNVPFDIIIDMSSLYEYSVDEGKIVPWKNDINFKEIFPNSYVIKIDDFGNKSQRELLEILREKLMVYNEAYSYIRRKKPQFGNMNDDDFYVVNGDSLGTADIDDAYKSIRRVLLKR